MKQHWVLQGRAPKHNGEWLDLFERRSIKALPLIDRRIADSINAEYKVIRKVTND